MYEHSLVTRENVKQAYLHSGKTQQQIAEEFGISERTIRNWIKQFQWHQLKHRIHHPPSSLVESITIQLTNLQYKILTTDSGIPTFEQALTIQKLLSCLAKLYDEPHLSTLINILPPEDDLIAEKINPASKPAIPALQSIDNAGFIQISG